MKWKQEELSVLNLYRDGTKTIEQIRSYLKKSGYKRTYKSVARKLESLNIKKPLSNYSNINLPKILILDIETTPMGVWTWSLGKQYVGHHAIMKNKNGAMMDWHLLSWSAKWLYDSEVISDVLTPREAKARNDKRIMKSVWKLLNEADIIIAHNGDRFDLRKINARFIANDIKAPLPFKTIDTLKQARREFAFSSHKQDFITKFLKLEEKLDTEFQLWIDCMSGNQEALDRMEKYNRGDVIGLEDMYLKLRPYMKSHPNIAVMIDDDCCTVCGSNQLKATKKFYYTGSSRYRLYTCNSCHSPYIRNKNSESNKEITKRSVSR